MNLFEAAKTVPIMQIIEHICGLSGAHVQSGRTVMSCPFHGSDRTASFTIYENTNSFYCFGCSAGGDGIKFAEKFCHLSPVDAARMVCRIGGIVIDDSPLSKEKAQELEQIVAQRREKQLIESALTTWANDAYLKLCELRRVHFVALVRFEELRSDWCARLDYLDCLLDVLQYGGLADKLSIHRAARHGELGLAGVWIK